MNEKGRGDNEPARWRQLAMQGADHLLRRDRRLLWSFCTVIACGIALALVPGNPDRPVHAATMVETPLAVPSLDPDRQSPLPRAPEWQTVTVQAGQTLSQIFNSLGFGYSALNRLIAKPEHASALESLHPGDELGFRLSEDGSLAAIRYDKDPVTQVVLTLRNDDPGVSEQQVKRDVERRVHVAEGTIRSSLFAAGAEAGMSDAMMIKLAEVFKYDIDFIKDIRKGDHFSVIYDDVWRDGERLYAGRIIAAEFSNRGHRYTAYRFQKPDGSFAYYDEGGHPLQKALMRTPVKFSRISSRFSKRRNHPILGYTRAHEGVDYAAPSGTPIHAAGNGKIAVRGWVKGYGRYIRIKHGGTYSTAYGHMSRFAKGLRKGSHVRQGQVIGYVGQSGLATGPHLHYEVRVHGNPVNPLTVTMPKPKPLPDTLLAQFKASIQAEAAQLRVLDSNRRLLASRAQSSASPAGGSR